jgi:hypothetical protein
MLNFLRQNSIALLALFVALGGSAAAVGVAKNSVGTKQLKNNSVATSKLKNNNVTTAKLRNNSVTNAKLNANSVTSEKLRNGAVVNSKVSPGTLEADRLTAEAQTQLKGALAYAQVDDSGPLLVAERTNGFVSVERPFSGHYCLKVAPELESIVFDNNGNPVRPTFAVPEAGNTAVPAAGVSVPLVMGWGENSGCAPYELRVTTEGSPDPASIQNGTSSNAISFFVIIP